MLESLHLDKLSRKLQVIIGNGRKHPEYKIRLAVYGWQIYTLFRYTYLGKDGKYKKLSAQRYAKELFLNDAERPEELCGRYFTEETRENGFRIYKAICDAISPMLAYNGTERFWPDHIAFLVDYIMRNEGNVPPPDVEGCIMPYPKNYPYPDGQENNRFLPEEIAM